MPMRACVKSSDLNNLYAQIVKNAFFDRREYGVHAEVVCERTLLYISAILCETEWLNYSTNFLCIRRI